MFERRSRSNTLKPYRRQPSAFRAGVMFALRRASAPGGLSGKPGMRRRVPGARFATLAHCRASLM